MPNNAASFSFLDWVRCPHFLIATNKQGRTDHDTERQKPTSYDKVVALIAPQVRTHVYGTS